MERDTYTPLTPWEFPSLAAKDFMIAARSDLLAGLAGELAASALAARADASTVVPSVAVNDKRVIKPARDTM